MKIYVVTSGEYSEYQIEEVFTTRENAEKYIASRANNYSSNSFYIEEFEADNHIIQTKVYYGVDVVFFKKTSKIRIVNETYFTHPFATRCIYETMNSYGYIIALKKPYREYSEEEIQKVARDEIMKNIAEESGL